MPEHLRHVEVEGTLPVGLHKREVRVAGRLAHHVHRGALALGNLAHVVEVFLLNEQPHTLLALVGNDFLGRECGVADRQCCHVDTAAAFLHEFREAVHVTCRTVVVDRHHGVHLLLAEGADEVVGTLLHLGISALHGVQFDAA